MCIDQNKGFAKPLVTLHPLNIVLFAFCARARPSVTASAHARARSVR
jgi:hypothetical protein